jgi:hypothetical protein
VICPSCHIERGRDPCPLCSQRLELKDGLFIYPENLAAHQRSGESQQRRRWYDIARRRWLSGRNAPRVQEC